MSNSRVRAKSGRPYLVKTHSNRGEGHGKLAHQGKVRRAVPGKKGHSKLAHQGKVRRAVPGKNAQQQG